MKDFKKQFNKGVLELVILKLLIDSPHYGYSLMQDISKQSGKKIEIKDGTLYPILYRLEDQQIIESYWETTDDRSKKPRKYYRITKTGIERYHNMLKDYLEVQSGINQILNEGDYNEKREIY